MKSERKKAFGISLFLVRVMVLVLGWAYLFRRRLALWPRIWKSINAYATESMSDPLVLIMCLIILPDTGSRLFGIVSNARASV